MTPVVDEARERAATASRGLDSAALVSGDETTTT